MENNRVGNKELLVARSNKRYKKICRRLQYMLENEEQNRNIGKKAEVEQNSRKAVNTSNSRLHHKVTISSWKRCNPSSL